MRFKKVHLFGTQHPPKSILATGLEKSFLFRQSGGGGHLDVRLKKINPMSQSCRAHLFFGARLIQRNSRFEFFLLA